MQQSESVAHIHTSTLCKILCPFRPLQSTELSSLCHSVSLLIIYFIYQYFQLLSCVQLFVTPWTAALQASLSITNSWSFLKLIYRVSDAIQPSHPHPFLHLPSIFPSIRVFSSESVLNIMWSKYWSFSFSISPSNEYSGLIFFRINWFDLLTVHGTIKSLLQHHSSKALILWCLAFFIVQLSHIYIYFMYSILYPGEGNGNPLQYSCLENPMDRGAWQATVYGVARVGHDLATFTFTLLLSCFSR